MLGNPTVGEFTTEEGNFSVSVAPLDSDGALIFDVDEGDFTMEIELTEPGLGKSETKNMESEQGNNNDTAVATACVPALFVEVIRPGEDEPINVVLDFDTSGSMDRNDPDRLSIEAGKEIVELLSDDDKAAVVEFGGDQAEVVQEFTSDKELLIEKIDALEWGGWTPLYDSVFLSLEKLEDNEATNPSVIILADGDNNRPPNDRDELVAQANQQNTPLYSIALGDELDFDDLIYFSDNTGGIFAEAEDAEALDELFDNFGLTVTQGRVDVNVNCQFEDEVDPGNYEVRGDIESDIGGNTIEDEFEFPVNISE